MFIESSEDEETFFLGLGGNLSLFEDFMISYLMTLTEAKLELTFDEADLTETVLRLVGFIFILGRPNLRIFISLRPINFLCNLRFFCLSSVIYLEYAFLSV